MNTASPSKRRALAPVDANTRSPLGPSRLSPSKPDASKPKMALGTSPTRSSPSKRPMEQESDQEASESAKKRRISVAGAGSHSPHHERSPTKDVSNAQRPRSVTPEDSSLFDNSTINNSQATLISEPEVDAAAITAPTAAAPTHTRQRSMTREEARQKAEILRLRLGLASYKVRTNQADVPLERLQVRPLPGKPLRRRAATTTGLPATSSFPPATSPRSIALAAMSRSNERRQLLSSPVRKADASSSRTVLPSVSLTRRESGSSVAGTAVHTSPIRRRDWEQTLPPAYLATPQRKVGGTEDLSDTERGGAAEGLLSLSQSSPASNVLK
ncbi:hypothetical protein F4808DRAFT_459983 [Astrocystis sublimbata]|nr:hypothetical protein F4808DRAFT_459983 [Astrocystis sublimbata]